MQMIFCVVLIIAAVCIAALVCYVVSGKVLQEKIKERDTKKAVLAKKSKRWHEKAVKRFKTKPKITRNQKMSSTTRVLMKHSF